MLREMSRAVEESNRRMLRARDAMDRAYAQPLDIPALAAIAHVSEAHFIRTFRATFGETPHRYLQRRRIERSMCLLRETDTNITQICLDVGFTSLGTFSRTFREIVGESPAAYRSNRAGAVAAPTCFAMAWMRRSSFGEAAEPEVDYHEPDVQHDHAIADLRPRSRRSA
jgi:AraC-like DNA-binding protein